MRATHFFLLFFSISIIGCNNNPAPTKLKKTTTIIEIGEPENGSLMDLSKVFSESLNFIPLESSPESLLGNVSKMQVYNNKIFILDIVSRSINIFDLRDGHFLSKIRPKGNNDFRDFVVRDNEIVTLSYLTIIKYSENDYSYLGETKFDNKKLKLINPINFLYFSDNLFYIWNNKENSNYEEDYFIKKYVNGKNEENFIPHSLGYKSFDIAKFSIAFSGESYISPAINLFDIYKVEKDSISIIASLKFKNAISPKFLDSIKNVKDYSNLSLQNDYFKEISNIIKLTSDLFYFECIGPESYRYSGIFSVKTQKIIEFGKNDFLHSPKPFYSDGIFLYAFYEPSQLLRIQREGERNNFYYKKIIENQLTTKEENNLIIIKVKINEKL